MISNPDKSIPDLIQANRPGPTDEVHPEKVDKIQKEIQKKTKESFFTNYALKNNFFRSKVFSIGFFSVFITILAFYVILEISNLTSIVFYNLVEAESGDSEILLTRDPRTQTIETLFQYDESEVIKENIRREVNSNSSDTQSAQLTPQQVQELLQQAAGGDRQAAVKLLQSNSLSIEQMLELLPNILEGIGLMQPETLRKMLFQQEYVDKYTKLLQDEFADAKEIDSQRVKMMRSLNNFIANNQSAKTTTDKGLGENAESTSAADGASSEFTYMNQVLGLRLPTVPDLGAEFDRSRLMGVSGRWILPANVTNPEPPSSGDPAESYRLQANLIITDIANEIKSGIGRNSDLKAAFDTASLNKFERKEDIFEDSAVVRSTIASYLALDQKLQISINFDYVFNKLGFDGFRFENFIDLKSFIDYFDQIKFDKASRRFSLGSETPMKAPEMLSFVKLEDVVQVMNQGLDRLYSLFDQVDLANSDIWDQLPFGGDLIKSQFPEKKDLDDFIATFWENTYSTFLDQIGELINSNLRLLSDLSVDFSVQGQLSSPKGLFNSLLGNVIFLDRKGLSKKIVKVLETQLDSLQGNIDDILDIDGIPTQLRTNFIDPYLSDNIQNLRDIIRFMFEGNAEGKLFQTSTQGSLFGSDSNPFEPLRKSDFKGVFSYFPLTQIYSPNKDILYEDLNHFEENSDVFSDGVASLLDNKFAYLYTNPLKLTLKFMNNLHIFIKVLLINIVIVLGVINLIIIYSLTSLAVNEKNFEYGILRALGLKKAGLLSLIGNSNPSHPEPRLLLPRLLHRPDHRLHPLDLASLLHLRVADHRLCGQLLLREHPALLPCRYLRASVFGALRLLSDPSRPHHRGPLHTQDLCHFFPPHLQESAFHPLLAVAAGALVALPLLRAHLLLLRPALFFLL